VAAIRTIEAEEDRTAPPCVMSSRVTAARQWDGAGSAGRGAAGDALIILFRQIRQRSTYAAADDLRRLNRALL
jgi:hypothetical protein